MSSEKMINISPFEVGNYKIYRSTVSASVSQANLDYSASVGEIVCMDSEAIVGLAVMRLSDLTEYRAHGEDPCTVTSPRSSQPQHFVIRRENAENEDEKSERSDDHSQIIYPFKPQWWPNLDLVTGQPFENHT